MAERRMFSKAIISSGKFLRMPPTSRLLYYDLGMAADDDGVVEAYSIMTQTKATEDDLRVLVSKGYIRLLNEDLVSLITDWKINNAIRADRYHPSIYAELITSTLDNRLTTIPQPNDNQMDTEVRLGQVSKGKGKEIEPHGSKRFAPPSLEEVKTYCCERKNNVDPQRFIDYYTANGWKVGKNSMKDWKAAVRTWERRESDGNGTTDNPRSISAEDGVHL